jgi:predicted aspartyl protease
MSSVALVSQSLQGASKEDINLLTRGDVQNKNFISTIPIEFRAGIPIVDVEINKKKYKFMFDTGAFSIIPKQLVKELNLQALTKHIDIIDAAGKKDVLQLYTLPSLYMGGVEFVNFTVAAENFKEKFPMSCLGFDGIVGYSFLKDLVLKLDYKEAKISLSDKPMPHRGYNATQMIFETRYAPTVAFDFGFGKTWIGLDTGKNDGILLGDTQLNEYFTKEGLQSRKTVGIFSSTFSGIGENRQRESYVVKNFRVAKKIKIKSFVIDTDDSGQFLAGNDFLKHFNIIIDFKRKKAYFQALEESPIEEGFEDDFGFSFFFDEEKSLFISALEENSPAQKAGLQLDDKVLELDGVDTLNFTSNDFCRLILKKRHLKKQRLEMVIHRDHSKILKKVLVK